MLLHIAHLGVVSRYSRLRGTAKGANLRKIRRIPNLERPLVSARESILVALAGNHEKAKPARFEVLSRHCCTFPLSKVLDLQSPGKIISNGASQQPRCHAESDDKGGNNNLERSWIIRHAQGQPNGQRQRPEPAATVLWKQSDPNGWLWSAARWG